MIRLIWIASVAIRAFLRRYMPTNICSTLSAPTTGLNGVYPRCYSLSRTYT